MIFTTTLPVKTCCISFDFFFCFCWKRFIVCGPLAKKEPKLVKIKLLIFNQIYVVGTEKDEFIDLFVFLFLKKVWCGFFNGRLSSPENFVKLEGVFFYCINIFHRGLFGPHSRSNWTLANPDGRLLVVDCCSNLNDYAHATSTKISWTGPFNQNADLECCYLVRVAIMYTCRFLQYTQWEQRPFPKCCQSTFYCSPGNSQNINVKVEFQFWRNCINSLKCWTYKRHLPVDELENIFCSY